MNRAVFFDRDSVLNIDTINLYKHRVEGTVAPHNVKCDCRNPKPDLIDIGGYGGAGKHRQPNI